MEEILIREHPPTHSLAMAFAMSTFTGAKLSVAAKAPVAKGARMTTVCKAEGAKSRRAMLSFAAVSAVLAATPKANADIVEDLLAKSAANKELNDKKRKATSGANFARSRTVTDGTCAFPNNLVGCENLAERGDVKFLSDDLKLECEGTSGICPAKAKGSLPSFLGV